MKRISVSLTAFKTALALVSTAMCVDSYAQGIRGYPESIHAYDSREIAMLPHYCIYTQDLRDRVPGGNNQQMIQNWYARLGPTFHAMHHYCWGLMKTNRAVLLARDETTRHFNLQGSLDEFDYVIRHAPTDFVLLPEILSKKGQNLIRLGKGVMGIAELERAIELKPDYWPPYGHISDYYKGIGDIKAAKEWLTKGLGLSPDAKGLMSRLSELDSPERASKGKR